MGKHDNGASYPKVSNAYYPTPPWVTKALLEYVDVAGQWVWEPACGDGRIAEVLRQAGASVYCSDIEDRGYARMDERLDFTSGRIPKLATRDPFIITNPPISADGKTDGRLAVKFVEVALKHTERGGEVALLLPPDFDSGSTRQRFFADCPRFAGKIVLLDRPVWFTREDNEREAPKENRVWFLWSHDPERTAPFNLYARTRAPKRLRRAEQERAQMNERG
jgi:hypothetical protein